MELLIFIVLLVFVIGAVVGSFLNVVILRGLSGESIVLPPSKCPHCHNKLKPWHNIPILSYLFLRGKCGFCKEKISIQYPIIEAITGIFFVATLFKFGPTITAMFAFIVACTMIVLSVTDIKEKVICVAHAYFLIIAGLLASTYTTIIQISDTIIKTGFFLPTFSNIINTAIASSILGLIAGIVVMEILARLGYLLVGTRAFGEGDSYIAAGLGAVFGWKNLLIIIALSIAIQLVMTLPVFVIKLVKNKDYRTLMSLVIFFTFAGIFAGMNYLGFFENAVLMILMAIVFLAFGIYACRKVLGGLKTPDDFTMLPFGPAMVIAAFVVMFVTPIV